MLAHIFYMIYFLVYGNMLVFLLSKYFLCYTVTHCLILRFNFGHVHDQIYNVYQQIGAVYFLDSYNRLHLRYDMCIILSCIISCMDIINMYSTIISPSELTMPLYSPESKYKNFACTLCVYYANYSLGIMMA